MDHNDGYKWTGNSGVKFHDVTCGAPNTLDNAWNGENFAMINDENLEFFRLFKKDTGCTATPESCGCYGRGVGLSATAELIEKLKKDIEEQFVSCFITVDSSIS